jgi:RNA polymerase sigma factor (sigma-70 family)
VSASERTGAERLAREACAAGEIRRATTILLTAYGSEVLGFLRWLLRDDVRGDDAFADFSLDVWRGLPSFDWRCSARTWLYVVARRAGARVARSQRQQAFVPLSASAPISQIVERLRSETAPHLRTDMKSEIRRLWERLDQADQELLVLRIDRRLVWREISLVLAEEGIDERERTSLEALLRKRYQVVKERLRSMAKESGLLPR